MKSWRFFILAGGCGIRARPLSAHRAKPAFPLAGIPLITRLIGQILGAGTPIPRGWVNVHHLPETIRAALNPAWPVTVIEEAVLSGSRVLTQTLEDPDWSHLLVVNGDLYCRIPLADLQTAVGDHDGLLLLRPQDEGGAYRSIGVRDGRFSQRLPGGEPGPMYTGICVLTRRAVAAIRSDNFFDGFERENVDLAVGFLDGLWLDIGDPRAYLEANLAFLQAEGLAPQALWSAGARVLGDPALVSRTALWPGCEIRPGTGLESCVVCDGVVPASGDWHQGVWAADGFHPFP
jgi:glucose-1-phosphate thymidylyltransferase